MAAVAVSCTPESVHSFGTFTADLHRLVEWFGDGGIKTVVMASTGVYWIPAFEILDARGFTYSLSTRVTPSTCPGARQRSPTHNGCSVFTLTVCCVQASAIEGEIAGLAAAFRLGRIGEESFACRGAELKKRHAAAKRGRAFRDCLFHPADSFRIPLSDDVIVCRCEEVTAGQLRELAALPQTDAAIAAVAGLDERSLSSDDRWSKDNGSAESPD